VPTFPASADVVRHNPSDEGQLSASNASLANNASTNADLAASRPQNLDNPAGPSSAAGLQPSLLTDLIAGRVLGMRQINATTLAVVVRPDAQTELHLNLKLHGEIVEVRAHCERGDSAVLARCWGQMQHALSHQGVRLMPLDEPRSNPAQRSIDAGS